MKQHNKSRAAPAKIPEPQEPERDLILSNCLKEASAASPSWHRGRPRPRQPTRAPSRLRGGQQSSRVRSERGHSVFAFSFGLCYVVAEARGTLRESLRGFSSCQVPRLSPEMSVTFILRPEIETDPEEDANFKCHWSGCGQCIGWSF